MTVERPSGTTIKEERSATRWLQKPDGGEKGVQTISDFSGLQLHLNTGTDVPPGTFTTAQLNFGGGSGQNELRFCAVGAAGGSGNTSSANWPLFSKPASVQAVAELWAYLGDASGNKVATYTGTAAKNLVARWAWSSDGTFASAPKFSAFADTTFTAPSPGTQPAGANNDPITNGHATDTSSKSYLKANAYGFGVTNGGVQQTPPASGGGGASDITTTTLLATSGVAGAASPASAAWLATWQSLQGWLQNITNGQTPQTTGTAGQTTPSQYWYWALALFTGPNMTPGNLLPLLVFQYTFS